MQIAYDTNKQLMNYKENLDTRDTKKAQSILDSLVNNYQKDKLYELLLLAGFNQKGYLLFHRNNSRNKYYQGEKLENKSIFLYSKINAKYLFYTLRFLPCIKSLNPSNITIQVPTLWLEFFKKNIPDLYTFSDKDYDANKNDYNYHCDVLSLPYIFDKYNSDLPLIPHYFHFDTSNSSISVGLLLDIEIPKFDLQIDTEKILTTDNIDSLATKISTKDIIITDNDLIAHLCGVMNIKCYFITPSVSSFEWGIDNKSNQMSNWYQNVYLFRNNLPLKQILLDISASLKQDINNKRKKIPIIKEYNNHYSFCSKIQTIFMGKNMQLFKQANDFYKELNLEKSFQITKELLEHYPTSYELNHLIAKIYIKLNKVDEAIYHLGISINNTKNSQSYYEMGRILQAQGKYKESIEQYNNAIALEPKIEYYNSLAMVYQYNIKNSDTAIATLKECIQKCDCSSHKFIYYNLGVFYQEISNQSNIQNINEAIKYFKKDIEINPDSAKTYNNIGNVYRLANNSNLSIKYLQQAVHIDPTYDKSYSNLAITLKSISKNDNIIQIYKQGLSVTIDNQHNIAWNLSLGYLLLGEYTLGWELYESRLQKPEFNSYYIGFDNTRIYNGQELSNKHILIHYEQGFGDTIQFIRYLPLLQNMQPSKITMIVQKELLSLFKYSMPNYNFCVYEDMPNDYDYHCALMSLPYIFDTQINTIPNTIPYLFSPPKTQEAYVFDKKYTNIAIVWNVSDTALDKEHREIDLKYFYSLNKIKNSKIFSLQIGNSSNKINKDITDLSPYISDFSSTAQMLQDIDMVVCVDTAIAHLCGALNTPCYMILHKSASWRWLQNRNDTVWYNSLRIYRLDEENNINNIFENICSDIESRKIQNMTSKQTTYPKPQDLEKKYKTILLQAKDLYDNNQLDEAHFLATRLILKIQSSTTLGFMANIEIKRFNQTQNKHFQESAIFYINKLLEIKKSFDYYYQLGLLYKNSQDTKYKIKAMYAFENALLYDKNNISLKKELASIYMQIDMDNKAIRTINDLLQKEDDKYDFYFKLGFLYRKKEDYDTALSYYLKALNIKRNIAIYQNIADIYKMQTDYKNAIKYSKQGLILEYKNIELLDTLGTSYKCLNQIQEAKICYEQIFKVKNKDPRIGHNLAFLYLLQGDFKNGYKCAETRLYFPMLQNILRLFEPNKRYKGEDLEDKTIVLHYEQGFGDTIQFVRFANIVKEKNPKQIILLVQPELVDLFAYSFKYAKVLSYKKYTKENMFQYDYYCPIMSLPYVFNTSLYSIPSKIPYLKSNAKLPIKMDKTKLNIGIVWETNRLSDSHQERSSSLGCFKSLLDIKNTQIYSLQVGSGANEIIHRKLQNKIIDTSKYLSDFNHTASLIKKLDIIVSVDTAVAHLAGALNKQCFMLSPFNPNWRWLIGSKTSPWYPSINIIRQENQNSSEEYLKEDYEKLIKEQVCPAIKTAKKDIIK